MGAEKSKKLKSNSPVFAAPSISSTIPPSNQRSDQSSPRNTEISPASEPPPTAAAPSPAAVAEEDEDASTPRPSSPRCGTTVSPPPVVEASRSRDGDSREGEEGGMVLVLEEGKEEARAY